MAALDVDLPAFFGVDNLDPTRRIVELRLDRVPVV
jgi:hypothetical protein